MRGADLHSTPDACEVGRTWSKDRTRCEHAMGVPFLGPGQVPPGESPGYLGQHIFIVLVGEKSCRRFSPQAPHPVISTPLSTLAPPQALSHTVFHLHGMAISDGRNGEQSRSNALHGPLLLANKKAAAGW